MDHKSKIACVIPARLLSSRFPRKVLALLEGKPLLQWTWEAAMSTGLFCDVWIAVDAQEVYDVARGFGAQCLMTSALHPNGTQRLIEVQQRGVCQADVWVNWQADEPFLTVAVLEDLLQSCQEEGVDVWTLKTPLAESQKADPNICKVVCDVRGHALYFSRSSIPYVRDQGSCDQLPCYRHVGLYAYKTSALEKMRHLPSCSLEEAEMLEQLRFLYYGLKIRVHLTQEDSLGIDLPEHLVLAQKRCSVKSG